MRPVVRWGDLPRTKPGWQVRGLAVSPDGRFFATGSNPPQVATGEVGVRESGTVRLRFPPLPHTNFVAALAFHPDGKILSAGDYNGLVRLWDASASKEIGYPLPRGEIVLALAYSPDGTVLAVGLASDHTGKPGVRIWDTKTREPLGEFMPSTEATERIEYGRMGGSCSRCISNIRSSGNATHGRAIGGPMVDETSGRFRPDGLAFPTLGTDGAVKLRDAATGAVTSRLMATRSPAIRAALRGDGGLVAAGFQDGSVRLCAPATSQPIGPPGSWTTRSTRSSSRRMARRSSESTRRVISGPGPSRSRSPTRASTT